MINHVFFLFTAAMGVVIGVLVALVPHARDLGIPPYFWVLIGVALFEGLAYWRGRGAPGTTLAMEARLLGFVLAILLVVIIPILAGSPGRLF